MIVSIADKSSTAGRATPSGWVKCHPSWSFIPPWQAKEHLQANRRRDRPRWS